MWKKDNESFKQAECNEISNKYILIGEILITINKYKVEKKNRLENMKGKESVAKEKGAKLTAGGKKDEKKKDV